MRLPWQIILKHIETNLFSPMNCFNNFVVFLRRLIRIHQGLRKLPWVWVLASGCAMATDDWTVLGATGSTAFQRTQLVEVRQDSDLSRKLAQFRSGGFESAQGAWVSFHPWYSSTWQDTGMAWMTPLTPNLGVIWGGSTGERGEKYTLAPSLKIGAVFQAVPMKDTVFSIKATTLLGGTLKEKSCRADYGDIGGVQEVNCRLAASTLAPAETLKYLLHEKPYNQNKILIQLSHRF